MKEGTPAPLGPGMLCSHICQFSIPGMWVHTCTGVHTHDKNKGMGWNQITRAVSLDTLFLKLWIPKHCWLHCQVKAVSVCMSLMMNFSNINYYLLNCLFGQWTFPTVGLGDTWDLSISYFIYGDSFLAAFPNSRLKNIHPQCLSVPSSISICPWVGTLKIDPQTKCSSLYTCMQNITLVDSFKNPWICPISFSKPTYFPRSSPAHAASRDLDKALSSVVLTTCH